MTNNPKLEGSNIIDCIPQTGYCPNRCQECYYNNGFFRTLDEPLFPTLEEVGDKIVRVNSGNDSNNQKDYVIASTQQYKKKFYNTSINMFDKFDAPIVYTALSPKLLLKSDINKIMAVRVRVNTWNLDFVNNEIYYLSHKKIPVLLTFMRYKLYDNVRDKIQPDGTFENYVYKKSILNNYWCIKEETWNKIVNKYKDNPFVYVCGRSYGNSFCKNCRNCETLYERVMEVKCNTLF